MRVQRVVIQFRDWSLSLSLPADGVIRRRPTQDDRSEDCGGGGQVTPAIWRQPQTEGDSSLSLGGLKESAAAARAPGSSCR